MKSQTAVSASPTDVVQELLRLDAESGAALIETLDTELAANALRSVGPQTADDIVPLLSEETRARILETLPELVRQQWRLNQTFGETSVGRLMEPTLAIFSPEMSVQAAIEQLRELVRKEFITYCYVVDGSRRLIGVITMRDLLFGDPQRRLEEIMLRDPFSLRAEAELMDAMKEVLTRHYPVYPVVDESGELVGIIRGHSLFEAQAIEISAQAGSMVGVEKEERLSTPFSRSFRYRHPWLQLNLITAFIAGAVVSVFQETIDQIVVLAAFLPVLAGQSGNTGCQALAVTLRGMTLQTLRSAEVRQLLIKEGSLGLANGALVGVTAGLGMYFLALSQNNPLAFPLSVIVFFAMIGSCAVSGLSGALVPLALRRLGADPATASSIFLTTATDVVSMGMLLALASWMLL